MDTYKNTGDTKVFALLFELNRASFLSAIQAKVRRGSGHVDAQDVLQEVFLNIYRYPRRFLCDRPDSFRNWGHRIVRNTLLKFLKGETRLARFTPLDEDMGQKEDQKARSPYRSASDSESAELVDFAYLVYLNLYLQHYRRLSQKEQQALRMVEVEGASYKATAAELGIRLENLKMVIFRGRRKIFRGLNRTLQDLATPCALEVASN
jgi:RNA polymerase sigma factor (sigma-70 family)